MLDAPMRIQDSNLAFGSNKTGLAVQGHSGIPRRASDAELPVATAMLRISSTPACAVLKVLQRIPSNTLGGATDSPVSS